MLTDFLLVSVDTVNEGISLKLSGRWVEASLRSCVDQFLCKIARSVKRQGIYEGDHPHVAGFECDFDSLCNINVVCQIIGYRLTRESS